MIIFFLYLWALINTVFILASDLSMLEVLIYGTTISYFSTRLVSFIKKWWKS